MKKDKMANELSAVYAKSTGIWNQPKEICMNPLMRLMLVC